MSDDDPTPALDAEFEWSNEAYRALGRFIVHFQWLCGSLSDAVVRLTSKTLRGDPITEELLDNLVGDAQPAQLLKQFKTVASILETNSYIEEEDRPFFENLYRRIDRLIEQRNSAVHGLWLIDPEHRASAGRPTDPPLIQSRRVRFSQSGLSVRLEERTPEQIHQLADEAHQLERLVDRVFTGAALRAVLVWDEHGDVRFRVAGDSDP